MDKDIKVLCIRPAKKLEKQDIRRWIVTIRKVVCLFYTEERHGHNVEEVRK